RREARAGPSPARPAHYNNAGRPRKRSGDEALLARSKPVTAPKLVDSTAGIDDLLLTRVERMAGRAHLDVQVVRERRARLDDVAAAARDRDLPVLRSEEHTSELQSRENLVCRLLLEKKK